MRRIVMLYAVLACTLAPLERAAAQPGTSTAASKDPGDEARLRYDRGVELYNAGDYRLALIEFDRAYALVPKYQVLFNVGQVNFQLNNYARALVAFEQYLREGGAAVPADRRAQVERDIRALKARTAHLSVLCDAPGADITIDDRPFGKAPVRDLLVDAGDHRITASKNGMMPETRPITLAAGDNASVTLKLTPIRVETERPEPRSYTWLGWVGTGVLAAGAVATGIVTGIKYGDYRDEKNSPAAPDDRDGSAKRQRIDDAQAATQRWFVVTGALTGAAALAGGLTWYFTSRESKAEPKIRVGIGTRGGFVSGTFD